MLKEHKYIILYYSKWRRMKNKGLAADPGSSGKRLFKRWRFRYHQKCSWMVVRQAVLEATVDAQRGTVAWAHWSGKENRTSGLQNNNGT